MRTCAVNKYVTYSLILILLDAISTNLFLSWFEFVRFFMLGLSFVGGSRSTQPFFVCVCVCVCMCVRACQHLAVFLLVFLFFVGERRTDELSCETIRIRGVFAWEVVVATQLLATCGCQIAAMSTDAKTQVQNRGCGATIKRGLQSSVFDSQVRAIQVLQSKLSTGLVAVEDVASDAAALAALLRCLSGSVIPLLKRRPAHERGEESKDTPTGLIIVDNHTGRFNDNSVIANVLKSLANVLVLVTSIEIGRATLARLGAVAILQDALSEIDRSGGGGDSQTGDLAGSKKALGHCLHVLLAVSPSENPSMSPDEQSSPQPALTSPLQPLPVLLSSWNLPERKGGESKQESVAGQTSSLAVDGDGSGGDGHGCAWTFPPVTLSHPDAKVLYEAVSYTHLTLPTIYSV